MTSVQFITRYPQFEPIDPDLVSAVLAEVLLQLSPDVYGTRLDAAHGAMAAHLIYISPAGSSLRGDSAQTGTSEYLVVFERIQRQVKIGFAVIT